MITAHEQDDRLSKSKINTATMKMMSAYLDQQEKIKIILGRETVSEHEVKYAHGRLVVPVTDMRHCVCDITND